MKRSLHTIFNIFGIAVLTLCLSACSKDDEPEKTQEQIINEMIAEVRAITMGMKNIDAGIAAGWNTDLSGCVEHPVEGGMGHHYGRLEYIDGRVNHLEPQILLYAPNVDSTLELVGVEYIIPFEILSEEAEAPELFFHKFHKNPVQNIWALHVWTEKENPNGMFYDWNPEVSCFE